MHMATSKINPHQGQVSSDINAAALRLEQYRYTIHHHCLYAGSATFLATIPLDPYSLLTSILAPLSSKLIQIQFGSHTI